MYTVCVRDHFMIAHSFMGEMFGPAQRLHGATYVVDLEFRRETLDENGVVVDIGLATQTLQSVLGELNYRNLDEIDAFAGHNTTTEFMARYIFDRIAACISEGVFGPDAKAISGMRVTLHESHAAWAAFEAPLEHAPG
jgi:6-pyruvoyl-tetrahydropterin synthase